MDAGTARQTDQKKLRMKLKAPFPAFGGKALVSDEVWCRLGNVRNYIEPFVRSGAVFLRRPHVGSIETINDIDGYITNFWRAVQADPAAVAMHADWPVNEIDLKSRHEWLTKGTAVIGLLDELKTDPDAFNARVAGWWAWGACCWIGAGWCDANHRNSKSQQRPDLDTGQLITARLPSAGNSAGGGGRGVNGGVAQHISHKRIKLNLPSSLVNGNKRVKLTGNGVGCGVHGETRDEHFGLVDRESDVCDKRREWIQRWMRSLSDRLRFVRVCNGHWSRICNSDSTMTGIGLTGVFLDPPYRTRLQDGSVNRTAHIYSTDKTQDVGALCDEVQEWCLRWGSNKLVRVALCGLEGEYPEIERRWESHEWKSNGGYGNRSVGNRNRHRERVWFSPHCLKATESGLFARSAS